MHTPTQPPARLELELPASGFILLVCPREMNSVMLTAIARLAALSAAGSAPGPSVSVLDCGNRFNAYTVARLARGERPLLERIRVARAFTCHQVLSLLSGTPAGGQPFVVLDLLNTFYDENVRPGERKWLLRGCLDQLHRLEQASGGLVSVHPPAVPSQAALDLLGQLERGASQVYYAQPLSPLVEQLRLV